MVKPEVKFELAVNGEPVTIDLSDIDGLEWRAIRQETGMRPRQLFQAAQDLDLEALAALLWVVQRRDRRDLQFDQVLGSINLTSFALDTGDTGEEDDTDPFGSDVGSI